MIIVVALGGFAGQGCSSTGDFGRHEPGFLEEQVFPVTRAAFGQLRGVTVSSYPLTTDEIELRARSQTIIEAERGWAVERRFEAFVEKAGAGESSYQRRRRVAHNSGRTAYDPSLPSRRRDILVLVVESDVAEFEVFGNIALLVYGADQTRRAALSYGGDLSTDDIRNTAGRIRENRRVVELTVLAMRNRVDDYRLELRRSVVEHPDASGRAAAAIERMAAAVDRIERRLRFRAFPEARTVHPHAPVVSRDRNSDLLGG